VARIYGLPKSLALFLGLGLGLKFNRARILVISGISVRAQKFFI
jgi:hypothetical protein